MRQSYTAREALLFKESTQDRLVDAQLLLDRVAGAADLVADDVLAASLAQASHLALQGIRFLDRKIERLSKELARCLGIIISQHALGHSLELIGRHGLVAFVHLRIAV